jgi:hypothetical protein
VPSDCYTVLEADNGAGRELAAALARSQPGLPVVLLTTIRDHLDRAS